MTLQDGRFWGQTQDDDLTQRIPRDVQIAAIGTLIDSDALDLVAMLFAPLNPTVGGRYRK